MRTFEPTANSNKILTREGGVWGTRAVVIAVVALGIFSPPAGAHNGPPFPIIVDQRVGPCVVSLWTHPDIGLGTFFVMVEAPPGGAIPGDLKIDLGIQPVDGRLAEVIYPTRREDLRGQLEFKTEVNFDRQDYFRARLILHSAQGDGESSATVEATPAGFGRWDLLLYLLPFAGVGFLWCKAVATKRKYRKMQVEARRPPIATCAAVFLCGTMLALGFGCGKNKLPDKSTAQYRKFVPVFYSGLAALQVGDDVRAESKLGQATKIVAGEPAAWADWGILALRQRNFDVAGQRLAAARELAPKNDRIYYLLGLLESNRGKSAEAIANWRKAIELNPQNLRATYQLAEEIERQGDDSSAAEFQKLVEKILAVQPNNLAALLELSRIAAKRGDAATLKATVERIAQQSGDWAPEAKKQLVALQAAVGGSDAHPAATRTAFLRNVLMRDSNYRQSLAVMKADAGEGAEPLTHFLRLETPVFTPAAADTAIRFEEEALPKDSDTRWNWIGVVSLSSEAAPTVMTANGREVKLVTGAKLSFPGGASNEAPLANGVLGVDFNYDFRTDLVLAGAGGVRFWRQDSADKFTDVTAQTKLPSAIANARYTGAWGVDIEADGDLDIVMGAKDGAPLVLQNNGDGSFTPIHPFAGVAGVQKFAWADFNADGNPDAAIVDGDSRLHVFMNDRSGKFHERALPGDLPRVKAIHVADANNDGVLDLLAVEEGGDIIRLSGKNDGKDWDLAVIASVPDAAKNLVGEVRLGVADVDNNGGFDLFLGRTSADAGAMTGAFVWLSDQSGKLSILPKPMGPAMVFDVADVDGKGRMDMLGLSADGQAMRGINRGARNYHWQTIRPRARQATGDQRINPFGVGGEMEIRSGLLVQKQPITGPQLHFGLGEQTGVDVARILWPNGSVRAEFDLKADQQVVTEQRLKGSCPFLFAFDGHGMRFVKDAVPWSSALGLRINNTGTAKIAATEEWYKIGADELAPHDGFYDLRITAELWETYYYDQLALMTVDHPAGTDIFVDERFVVPAARLAITTVQKPHKIARAIDDQGRDVTDVVATLDGKYLDGFARGQYQGVARDHYVEVDLGDDAPASGPLWLMAKGWMHPSDSSVNVAITQGQHEHAQVLSLEVPDGRGGWVVANPNLGFPAGRKKTCLIDLAGVFRPGTPRKVRLRTNLEIYWDSIEWALGIAGASIKTTRLDPQRADLEYRGYSAIQQANDSSPEIPDYDRLESSRQKWRDLSGYYTRFGDVRELLAKVDDRYVIMNAGDEMILHFAEQPPPPAGWRRDFVIVGDGWIKDGDYNTTFSKTVAPLPYHAKQEYLTAPGRLEDEWVYRQHPGDWEKYHTRFVTPGSFQNALRSEAHQ
ncbi:MAG: FG-GAP-like repeat-containing protein [Acidobacteriota bacterium]|nr:FG-GAP-like repeat-containing protein [Acidobacteriota bacterium]